MGCANKAELYDNIIESFKYKISQKYKHKDYDHLDSRYYKPWVFWPSQGLYIEVGCVFYVFFCADFEFKVGFLKFPLFYPFFRKNWSPNIECNSSYVIYSDLRQIYSNRPDSKRLQVDICKPWPSSWLRPTLWSAFRMLWRQPECRFLCCHWYAST